MSIVAFLQNQWFKDPPRMKQQLETTFKGDRERFIKTWLFFGCLTGKRLEAAFGDNVDKIIWEEVSQEMGGHSSAKFSADSEHIGRVLDKHQPTHVLAFGKIAEIALEEIQFLRNGHWRLIVAPHPAARGQDVPWRLNAIAEELQTVLGTS